MFRTKTDVDRHVAKTLAKLKTEKDRNFRGYSIARLYYDIGDFESCCRYAGLYLSVKSNNPAAHMLLGQAWQKLGNAERALAEYKASLDIQPNQMNLILKVCELLSNETSWDTGRARYWAERAATLFPQHPAVFRLRQRLLASQGADPADLVALAAAEATARPADPTAHARLLRRLVEASQPVEAFKHAFRSHFAGSSQFSDSLVWRDAVIETLAAHIAYAPPGFVDRDYWILRLAVLERSAETALAEGHSPSEGVAAIRLLDCALGEAAVACPPAPADALVHYGGQICLHAATLILKKGCGERGGWREAVSNAMPLLMTAAAVPVPDSGPYRFAAAYRRSQAGRTLLASLGDRGHRVAEKAARCRTIPRWRDELYVKLFGDTEKPTASHILLSTDIVSPEFSLPETDDLKRCEEIARSLRPDSLRHQVWLGVASDRLSDVVAPHIGGLPPSVANMANCGAETLNSHDLDAFLYCAVLTARQANENASESGERDAARSSVLPAALSRRLCTPEQIKWWECAHTVGRSADARDARQTLTRGIETVRCVGNHGLDPELLCILADAFSERSLVARDPAIKRALEARATLYYTVAVPLIRKLRDNVTDKPPERRLFDYTCGDTSPVRLDALTDRGKLFLAARHAADNDDDKAIEILDAVKSPYASFQLYKIYRKLADDQVTSDRESLTSENRSRNIIMLTKARDMIYLTSERLTSSPFGSDHPLRAELGEHIESVEASLSRIDPDMNIGNAGKHEPVSSTGDSSAGSERPVRQRESRRRPHGGQRQLPDGLEIQIRQLLPTFIEQTSVLVESNRILVEEVREMKKSIGSTQSRDDTADRFEKLKISVDGLKCAVEGYRDESAGDVAALKAEIAELKKEVSALKSVPAQCDRSALDDSELLLLEEETYAAATAGSVLSYLPRAPAQMYPTYPPGAVYPVYPGQYPAVPIFPPVFQTDRSAYREPQAPPVHNYQIPHPADPTPMFSLNAAAVEVARTTALTSTPLAPKATPTIPFNLFDTPQAKQAQGSASSSFGVFTSPAMATANISSKSRTLSERSGDSYDPMPDFKPVVDLPDEVQVTTGEEDEAALFDSRAKLYRFVNKEWKERGIGQIKLLKSHKTGKIRVLMRRERVHKICANHIIASDMEISRMKKDDPKSYFWAANDFADETVVLEKFCVRFKTAELGEKFYDAFCKAKEESAPASNTSVSVTKSTTPATTTGFGDRFKPKAGSWKCDACYTDNEDFSQKCAACSAPRPTPVVAPVTTFGGITFFTAPTFVNPADKPSLAAPEAQPAKPNPFAGFVFSKPQPSPVAPLIANPKDETIAFECKVKLSTSREKTPGKLKLLTDKSDRLKARLVMTSDSGEVRFDHPLEADTTFDRSPLRDDELTCTRAGLTVALAFEPADRRTAFESAVADVRRGWGDNKSALADMFKPKPGSWSCKSCYITNEGNVERCVACDVPKNPAAPTVIGTPPAPVPFKFGSGGTAPAATPVFGFLDRFKPKVGSWSCKSCYVDNEASDLHCAACDSPKDPSIPPKENKPITVASTTKFTFGIPISPALVSGGFSTATAPVVALSTTPIFGGFTPKTDSSIIPFGSFTSPATPIAVIPFGGFTSPAVSTTVTPFGGFTSPASSTNVTPFGGFASPAASSFSFGIDKSKDAEVKKPEVVSHNGKFQFTFKPKPESEKEVEEKAIPDGNGVPQQDDKDDEKYHDDDDGDHLVFEPIIPLPDKVEVKTGEEDEEVLYCHLAKLYRFDAGDWKECGVGDVKLLKHCLTSKLRVVMRRNPILKICLNHALTPDIVYTAKDTKTWLFHANDFSSEEITPQRFCLRFKNHEIAGEFKEAVESARNASESSAPSPQKETAPESEVPISVATFSTPPPAIEAAPATNDSKFGDNKAVIGSFKFTTPKGLEFAFGDGDAQKAASQQQNGKFTFSFNPKSPAAPAVAANISQDHDSGDEHYASDNEGDHLVFEPVVPLPDEVEVKTGEEDEEVVYSHRSKLFRFASGEWKECGVGDIKLLKHPETGKIRVLMRRIPVLKICLNHALTSDVQYTNKDPRSLLFSANDFSSGKIVPTNFCIRFKTETIADEFLSAVDAARFPNKTAEASEDDVIVISESQVSEEDRALARTLQLPEKFFAYRQREPCPGCVGCDPESEAEEESKPTAAAEPEPTVIEPVVAEPAPELREAPTSIFSGQKSIFGGGENIFAAKRTDRQTVIATPKLFQMPPFGSSSFGMGVDANSPLGSSNLFGAAPISSFGNTPFASHSFGMGDTHSIWKTHTGPLVSDTKATGESMSATDVFNSAVAVNLTTVPKLTKDIKLGSTSLFGTSIVIPESKPAPPPAFALGVGQTVDFSALAKMNDKAFQPKDAGGPFKWAGAGTPLFKSNDSAQSESGLKDDSGTAEEGEYDPYYAPIISMPDEIDVVTGEEDEAVVFKERCKLFRFTDSEWKERGRGTIKILKHKIIPLYRLLMRQEMVHKCILNQRITHDTQLQPMSKCKKAYVWAGLNYTTDHPEGSPEKLAVRFSTEDIAETFNQKFEAVQHELLMAKRDEELQDQDQDQYENDQDYDDEHANYDGEYDYHEEDEDEEGELSIVWSCDAVVDGAETKLNLLSSGEGSGRLQLLSMADDQIIKDLPVTHGDSVQFEGGECVVNVDGMILKATLPSESQAAGLHASFEEIIS